MKLTSRVNSVQFKLTAGYGIIIAMLIAALFGIAQTKLRAQLETETLNQVETNGEKIVAELMRRTTLVNGLTESIANVAANSDSSSPLLHQVLPNILGIQREQSLIAGGGYWPEPYLFDPQVGRSSFFWGRDEQGILKFYNDYNIPDGSGYHNEEWYTPARYLRKGYCYWSRSYIDPYSKQPMVTCTVAIRDGNVFKGASTIDLKLEGISEFFKQQTADSGGYAFAVDQNNRFISFPKQDWIQSEDGAENITIDELEERTPTFSVMAEELKRLKNKLLDDAKSFQEFDNNMVSELTNSYQINQEQAEVIAASLLDPYKFHQKSLLLSRLSLPQDPVLHEPSTALVFHVPEAYWKVVVVIPHKRVFSKTQEFIGEIIKITIIPLIIIMGIAFLGMRHIVIKPISKFTHILKSSSKDESQENVKFLDDSRKDEFGDLAYWYNKKTNKLSEVMNKLSKANSELQYQASFDSLTDLANRREMESGLKKLIDNDLWNNYSLLYLDIDQFKLINDTCGHIAGDHLLIQVGKVLSKVVRSNDLLARIGGDEFAIIVWTEDKDSTNEIISERVLKTIESINYSWEGKAFKVTCSIGSLKLSEIDKNVTEALRCVDNACYVAKDSGRNQVHYYEPNDNNVTHREGEMNWISKINNALKNNLFFIEFQLIAPTSQSSSLPAMESLIRMRDEEKGTIPPGAFLPAAERYNAIQDIDKWMINSVMMMIQENFSKLDKISYCSINLSADSICKEETIDYIKDRQRHYGIPANKICFEITETQVMLNLEKAKIILNNLRSSGFKVALDDFGAGMSSYCYLNELPVDLLKIDGHFVKDIKDNLVHRTFVQSMSQIAHAMGLETIAEFVEDDEIFTLLKHMGVNYAQGYGVAKPKSLDALIESSFMRNE